MALNLMGLLTDTMVYSACEQPLWADFGGNFDAVPDLKGESDGIRREVLRRAAVARAVAVDHTQDRAGSRGTAAASAASPSVLLPPPRAKFNVEGNKWPELPSSEEMDGMVGRRGMCDLDRTVVVTGFGEVGPWGSSRTRWELESDGVLSLEGCIELAYFTGLIHYNNSRLKTTGKHYIGWLDTSTHAPISDLSIKKLYEEQLLAHSGIRVIEPALFGGYEPGKKGNTIACNTTAACLDTTACSTTATIATCNLLILLHAILLLLLLHAIY